jgi:small subunit ribosomal protein S16
MLVIRMQRTGRKGHAQFRVVVQDSRRTPTSGKIVAALGHFNPHTKETTLNKEKAAHYLEHGAQPSDRVVRLLQSEGVKLPTWVKVATKKTGEVRNAEKRRSTRPAEPEAPAEEVAEEVEAPAEAPEVEAAPVAEAEAAPTEEAPAETEEK